ncbi:MAG TPA: hypothetical protein VMF32_12020, partial [Xanthobacteraceae bacterium]|nr:hypothetical protein [Xanthobacteraceae bacterium]
MRCNLFSARCILKVIRREEGGPPVSPPTLSGFGSALIDHGIPSATVKREFNPAGVICTIEVPRPESGESDATD